MGQRSPFAPSRKVGIISPHSILSEKFNIAGSNNILMAKMAKRNILMVLSMLLTLFVSFGLIKSSSLWLQ